MAQEETSGLGGWWKNLRNKASDAVADQQEAFARGKVAGSTVRDGAGNVLVEAGQRVDESVLTRVRAASKMGALAAAVVQAQAQDARESVQTHYSRTEAGREAQLLDSVEDYQAVHRYLGRMLTMDVTDIRGNVVVAAGKTLDHADAEKARESGLIAALLAAAEQSVAPPAEPASVPPPLAVSPRPAPRLLTDPVEEVEEKPAS